MTEWLWNESTLKLSPQNPYPLRNCRIFSTPNQRSRVLRFEKTLLKTRGQAYSISDQNAIRDFDVTGLEMHYKWMK